jgi:hypothetical protein
LAASGPAPLTEKPLVSMARIGGVIRAGRRPAAELTAIEVRTASTHGAF